MKIKSNSIVSSDGNNSVELPYGASLPSGSQLDIQGGFNFVGVSTITTNSLSASDANISGIITASSFIGDGSGLSVPSVSVSKSIAIKYIISDPPLRS